MAERYPKQVENTVGKGEIARYEQFLLFPQCFQKACFPGASKVVIVWEWVYSLPCDHRQFNLLLCDPQFEPIEMLVGTLLEKEKMLANQLLPL